MAKPRCKKHKRSLPYCDDCKAAVAKAEQEAASEELQAEVGFPKAEAASDEPETPTAAEQRIKELADATPEDDEQAPADETEEPEEAMVGLTADEEPAFAGETDTLKTDVDTNPPEGQVSDAEAAGFPDCPKPDSDEKLRQDGRREVITKVQEWFADGIDTGAFQLIEYLEEQFK